MIIDDLDACQQLDAACVGPDGSWGGVLRVVGHLVKAWRPQLEPCVWNRPTDRDLENEVSFSYNNLQELYNVKQQISERVQLIIPSLPFLQSSEKHPMTSRAVWFQRYRSSFTINYRALFPDERLSFREMDLWDLEGPSAFQVQKLSGGHPWSQCGAKCCDLGCLAAAKWPWEPKSNSDLWGQWWQIRVQPRGRKIVTCILAHCSGSMVIWCDLILVSWLDGAPYGAKISKIVGLTTSAMCCLAIRQCSAQRIFNELGQNFVVCWSVAVLQCYCVTDAI